MISSEKAFDMLPSVVDLYDKLDLDNYRKKLAEETKGKILDEKTVGIDLMKFVLKNSGKIKNEVFEIVALFEEKTVEEVKAQNFMSTVNTFKNIFADKEAVSFFKDAIQ